jgi:hypothetical protein
MHSFLFATHVLDGMKVVGGLCSSLFYFIVIPDFRVYMLLYLGLQYMILELLIDHTLLLGGLVQPVEVFYLFYSFDTLVVKLEKVWTIRRAQTTRGVLSEFPEVLLILMLLSLDGISLMIKLIKTNIYVIDWSCLLIEIRLRNLLRCLQHVLVVKRKLVMTVFACLESWVHPALFTLIKMLEMWILHLNTSTCPGFVVSRCIRILEVIAIITHSKMIHLVDVIKRLFSLVVSSVVVTKALMVKIIINSLVSFCVFCHLGSWKKPSRL